ncbi:cubilin-like protein [Leptotrombidium deliense]|uniref:Cubilin-like protein n=1 Tax=Leptotrombidium deliense TaxID=299467 RepID=A0A443ST29_9ACAR|nr:cubilin-like protein [Leptotrombidium deliense]
MEIRDGRNKEAPLIGDKRYCGDLSRLPNGGNFSTSNHYAYIEFATSLATSQFELTWNATEAICGAVMESEYGSIRFPPNGGYYAPNRNCYWLVKVPLSKKIQFHFPLVSIEPAPDCAHDFLNIYDGQNSNDTLLGKFCNRTQFPPLTTLSSYALVHFHSDATLTDLGFHLTFSSVPGIEGCGGMYSLARGVIRSPNFPLRYENGLECDYLIKLKSVDDTIYLNFTSFDLEFHAQCKFDYIEIFDGGSEDAPSLGRFCKESEKPPPFISTTNEIFIKFRTDGSATGTGFLGQYETNCGGYFNYTQGVIKSPSFPNYYPSGKECIYTILTEPKNFIKLEFLDFGLEHSINCTLDFVEVRQRADNVESVLAKFCGETIPSKPVMTTSNQMIVTFKSDGSVQNKGFLANYTSIANT